MHSYRACLSALLNVLFYINNVLEVRGRARREAARRRKSEWKVNLGI